MIISGPKYVALLYQNVCEINGCYIHPEQRGDAVWFDQIIGHHRAVRRGIDCDDVASSS